MRALIQRVTEATVSIDGTVVGAIAQGLVVLLGVGEGDTDRDADWTADKLLKLRIFADELGKMNRSVTDIDGELLVVSQFTLYADLRKGTRPSFVGAADPVLGERLYERVCAALRDSGLTVATGQFGAMMSVSLTNDGPVTIWLESPHA